MKTPDYRAYIDVGKDEPLVADIPYAETLDDAQEWIDDQVNHMNRTYAGCDWRVMRVERVRK